MKSIIISINPKWVCKILNGKKTIEIRKTMPKCELPIDVYIYVTKEKWKLIKENKPFDYRYYLDDTSSEVCLNGKVVAKFTLNKVEEIACEQLDNGVGYEPLYYTESIDNISPNYEYTEYISYLGIKKDGETVGYAWHINNLEIFYKPKELSEFKTKAPQSWCYVEVEE